MLLYEVKSLSRVWFFATPWNVVYQAALSMGFSRQESWNGLPFTSPGELPNPGIEPRSPTLQADALPSELPGKPCYIVIHGNRDFADVIKGTDFFKKEIILNYPGGLNLITWAFSHAGSSSDVVEEKTERIPGGRGSSNCCTIALISHASKVILEVLQAILQ